MFILCVTIRTVIYMKKTIGVALLAAALFAVLLLGRTAPQSEREGYTVPSVFVKEIQNAKNRI